MQEFTSPHLTPPWVEKRVPGMRARTGATGRVDGVGRLDVGVNLPRLRFYYYYYRRVRGRFFGVRMRALVVGVVEGG